jgi:hypothetical protein
MSQMTPVRRHTAGFSVTRAVQDMCYGKRDTAVSTDSGCPRNKCPCEVCVTDPEARERHFVVPDGSEGEDCHSCTDGFTICSLLPRALSHLACHETKQRDEGKSKSQCRELELKKVGCAQMPPWLPHRWPRCQEGHNVQVSSRTPQTVPRCAGCILEQYLSNNKVVGRITTEILQSTYRVCTERTVRR